MTDYRVKWEIDVDADSAEEAARLASAMQRRRGTTATVYTVSEVGGSGLATEVDLLGLGTPEAHVVAFGSPFEGLSVVGPFEGIDDALDYMEDIEPLCWLVRITNPD
jgi:hypothetical protein